MQPLFSLISEVMFERVDEMKEIIEHPISPAVRESSIFALCSPLSEADFHIPIRDLIGTGAGGLEADAERIDTVEKEQLPLRDCFDSSRAASLRDSGFIADDFVHLKHGRATDRL